MKKISILALLFAMYSNVVSAQTQPPVLNGLIQHLDAAVGFSNGSLNKYIYPPSLPAGFNAVSGTYVSAKWADQSPLWITGQLPNDVETGNIMTWCDASKPASCPTASVPIETNANPQQVANVMGTGFTGILFDKNDYMESSTANPAVAAHGLEARDLGASPPITGNTESTIFCVRMQKKTGWLGFAGNDEGNVMVSLSSVEPNSSPGLYWPFPAGTPPAVKDEFALMRDWGAHIASLNRGTLAAGTPNILTAKEHQCFSQLPLQRPAVVAATYGTNFNDLEYYVNGIQSTNPLLVSTGFPSSLTHEPVGRLITIGSRRCNIANSMNIYPPFEGYIFEVLVYNRKLTQTEIDATNEYLLCKYDINYTACNNYPTTCPKGCYFSPQMVISHLGNCQFQAVANGTPRPGVTILGYEWNVPGVGVFISSSNTQTFSLASGSAGNITVRILGVNLGMNDDNPTIPICCEYVMTKKISCDGGTWAESKNASTISEALAESTSDQVMIFPNPTKGDIYIKNPEDKEMNVSVMDLTGKKIATSKAGKGVTKMSIGENAAAMYMVIITDELGNVVKSARLVLDK